MNTVDWANIAGTGFVERQEEIAVLSLALLTREHALLIGNPGVAKSALANAICKSLGGKFFSLLMTRFTTPEEVFGPLSLKALEEDRYERSTAGYLPHAKVAFLDEAFRANSAILNSLLGILNERVYFEHGRALPVPLEMCVGATNDLPDDDAGLEALYDRFLFRQVVNAIADQNSFAQYLLGGELVDGPAVEPDALEAARKSVEGIKLSPDIIKNIIQLKVDMSKQKPGIVVSDRRWRKAMKALRACAYLRGVPEVQMPDLWVLQYVLWSRVEERPVIETLIQRLSGPKIQIAGLGSAAATMATGLSGHAQQYAVPPLLKNGGILRTAKNNTATLNATLVKAKDMLSKVKTDPQLSNAERKALTTEWTAVLHELGA